MAYDICKLRYLMASAIFLSVLVHASLVFPATVTVKKADGFDPASLKRVAFLPFAHVHSHDKGMRSSCPVGGESFVPCKVDDAAEAELSRAIGSALGAIDTHVRWIPQARINAARARIKKQRKPELTTRGSWQLAIGKELNADAVLIGFIYCYRDRSGSAVASSRSAAISFCMHLIDPATGKVLWSMRWEDEQKALSDNLLELPSFIKRKGKWISAREMAGEAADTVVKELPLKKGGRK